MPAPLSKADQDLMYRYAEMAHNILGCKGVSRTDFRFDESDDAPLRMAVLEINTQPGMTPLSLVPEIAAYAGISFLDLLEIMLNHATWEK
jgi:D-alanine-D-alanine ligase